MGSCHQRMRARHPRASHPSMAGGSRTAPTHALSILTRGHLRRVTATTAGLTSKRWRAGVGARTLQQTCGQRTLRGHDVHRRRHKRTEMVSPCCVPAPRSLSRTCRFPYRPGGVWCHAEHRTQNTITPAFRLWPANTELRRLAAAGLGGTRNSQPAERANSQPANPGEAGEPRTP